MKAFKFFDYMFFSRKYISPPPVLLLKMPQTIKEAELFDPFDNVAGIKSAATLWMLDWFAAHPDTLEDTPIKET